MTLPITAVYLYVYVNMLTVLAAFVMAPPDAQHTADIQH